MSVADEGFTRLTRDQIQQQLEDIGKGLSEADAARVRTLIFLLQQEQQGVTLPEKMSDREYINCLGALMRAGGQQLTQIAWHEVFGASRKKVDDIPFVEQKHLPPIWQDRVLKCTNLKSLYRMFPRLKKPGVPSGFPKGRGKAAQADWCVEQAYKIALDEVQKNAAALKVLEDEKQARKEGMDAAPGTPPEA